MTTLTDNEDVFYANTATIGSCSMCGAPIIYDLGAYQSVLPPSPRWTCDCFPLSTITITTNTTNPLPPLSKKKKKKARAEQQWTPSISRKRWLKLSRFLSGPDVPYSKTASWFVDLIEDWENASEW